MLDSIGKVKIEQVNSLLRMTSFFRKIGLCGCVATRSRSDSSQSKNCQQQSVNDEISKTILLPIDHEEDVCHDLAMHFDLSDIKYIDEDDPDNEDYRFNGMMVFFSFLDLFHSILLRQSASPVIKTSFLIGTWEKKSYNH